MRTYYLAFFSAWVHTSYNGNKKAERVVTLKCKEFVSFLFVFLFFLSHSKIFHSYGDVTIAGEGLQIFTYVRHSWPLSSGGPLAFHTHCDTGHPFIMVISEDPGHLLLMLSV